MLAQQSGYIIGLLIGALTVGAVCGLAPLLVGLNRKRPALAWAGFWCSVGGGLLLGLLGAVPTAVIFTVIILAQARA